MLTEEDKQWIAQQIAGVGAALVRTEKNLMDVIESLRAEGEAFRGEVTQALQRIEVRLDRQGGLVQGGTRQIARLIDWSEEIDPWRSGIA
jgi:hypothetical protein